MCSVHNNVIYRETPACPAPSNAAVTALCVIMKYHYVYFGNKLSLNRLEMMLEVGGRIRETALLTITDIDFGVSWHGEAS